MKTQFIPTAYEIVCSCGETVSSPSFSLFWTTDEIVVVSATVGIRCSCGKAIKVPKRIREGA